MKLKNSYFFTHRENVSEEESISGNLLVRSAMIKKSSSGVYMYLPLGLKVLENINKIIREEMNKINAQELLMPALIQEDMFIKSGRRDNFGKDMFSFKDRFEKNYVLAPTHEELFALAASFKVKSYKDLPFSLYQIQTKFRDEPRPRYGLIRVREFFMKDAYSFDRDEQGLDKSYRDMYQAYCNIFDRLNINYIIVKSDTGAMGGILSEEFQALSPIGEDDLVKCSKCDYSSNIDIAEGVCEISKTDEEIKQKEEIHTPNARTIKEISEFLDVEESKFIKTLIYKADEEFYAVLVNGNDDVNETKLRLALKAKSLQLASQEDVEEITKAPVGFAGPIDLNIKMAADNKIKNITNAIVGANKLDYHIKNVNLEVDFNPNIYADITFVKKGCKCPKCNEDLMFEKGIEVGNLFKLGAKYSEAMNLMYTDENNKTHPVIMGSYGIGTGRCMAAIVEQNNDEKGIIWPIEVAPYKVGIIVLNTNEESLRVSQKFYDELQNLKIDVLLDDRDERAGVKFNDMDLIGIPICVIIGSKLNEGIVEVKIRNNNTKFEVNIDQVVEKIKESLSI